MPLGTVDPASGNLTVQLTALSQAEAYLNDTFITNAVGLASYTILLWDHIVTFGDEVKYIWKADRRKTFIVCLFLFNRYFIPLGFMFNLLAYFAAPWKDDMFCSHFVRFEGAVTLIGLSTTALMMMLRVYALHRGNHSVLFGLGGLFLIQLGVYTWLLTNGKAVPLPGLDVQDLPQTIQNIIHRSEGCSMVFDPIPSGAASASAWLPWLYDTVVIILVVYKSLLIRRGPGGKVKSTGTDLTRALIQDGLLYYSVIFAANCSLTIMIIRVSTGLKNLMAQFEVLITVTMMSRITISLRKHAKPDEDEWVNDKFNPKLSTFRAAGNVVPPVPAQRPNHRHHIHQNPHRAPGETTFGSYSAHVATYVPPDPSHLPPPRTPARSKSTKDHRPGELVTFGSESAHAATYVPPPGTDRQVDRDSSTGPAPANGAITSPIAARGVQFRNISPPATPGTRTPARIPRSQTPVQSFAEWTFGVGGPLRPWGRRSDPWQREAGERSEQSMYSQESANPENIELENTKYGGVIEHVERV